jgi:2-polyprenyl-6-hydroxyphenyl methylase/3-demethylubiquinone-9 3-methyltransferase
MAELKNVDASEIEKFNHLAQVWWDPEGEMRTLQVINPLRMEFITEELEVPSLKVLDVGCGGGVLTEALAKTGAEVTGIDLSSSAIEIAREHARQEEVSIDYRVAGVEEIAREQSGVFGMVTCMEMLEHVPDPEKIVSACAQALKPGGQAFFSSINRTPKAFLFAIVAGEYVLGLLPRGTHTYRRLIRPGELRQWAWHSGLQFARSASLMYNPITGKFKLNRDIEDINYILHFIKI